MADVNSGNNPQETISDYYENYTETQREILAIEIRKTRNCLFIIAAIIFGSDLLGLMMLPDKSYFLTGLLIILVAPAIIAGMGFLALKEQMLAMIISSLIIAAAWAYSIIATGGRAAMMGWLIKAVLIYFFIAGFRHAAAASRIKKELNS